MKPCRYCPKLNKTGHITSNTKSTEYNCMKNISCRSSNLIYCLTCTRCRIQYVGQTILGIVDRIGGHLCDTESGKLLTSVARHFSQRCHNSIDDKEIMVLEFISKAPRSQAAGTIRDRVERKWMNLLRTCSPQGLNIDD